MIPENLTQNVGYYRADEYFEAASWLMSADGENTEYDRALADLVTDLLLVPRLCQPQVYAQIAKRARLDK